MFVRVLVCVYESVFRVCVWKCVQRVPFGGLLVFSKWLHMFFMLYRSTESFSLSLSPSIYLLSSLPLSLSQFLVSLSLSHPLSLSLIFPTEKDYTSLCERQPIGRDRKSTRLNSSH